MNVQSTKRYPTTQGRVTSAGVSNTINRKATSGWTIKGANPDYMQRRKPQFDFLMDSYFRTSTRGWERLPEGPCLLIGIHAGTWFTMDAWMLVLQWYRRFGDDRPLHGTAHDVLMALPGLGKFFRNVGVIPASRDAVTSALAAGHSVVVWPGGEVDSMRSYKKRNEVHFNGRRGFVKQAIMSGVPIVPVATVGGSETVFVLSEGRLLAKMLGFKKFLRSETAPIVAGLPFGVWPELLPTHIPLPAKITTEILDPIVVDTNPKRADDDDYVNNIYDEVVKSVSEGVGRLAGERRFPILG